MKLLIQSSCQSICAMALSCLLAVSVQAGVRDVGNPGKGVFINSELVLLDLYEVGVFRPVIDDTLVPEPIYLERAQRLSFLSRREAKLLAVKLTEIRTVSPRLADTMAVALNLYVWRMLDQKLAELLEPSPLELPTEGQQLANRLGGIIRISREGWKLLNAENRVALVLHETMMALSPSIFNRSVANENDSLRIRQVIGYLFMPEFQLRGIEGFAVFSGIEPVLTKIIGENLLLAAVDIVTIDSLKWGQQKYFDLSGSQGKEEKDAFCKRAIRIFDAKFGETAKFISRVKTISYEFKDYRTATGYQNGLAEVSTSGLVEDVPLNRFNFYQESPSHCIALLEQEIAKVLMQFRY